MRLKIAVLLVCLHLLVVAIRSFNTIVPGKTLISNPTVNLLLNTYTQYTVMQADYAFFSPNIGSWPHASITVFEGSDSLAVPFNLYAGEKGIRLFTSLQAFNNTPEARELMTRSWAAHALKSYPAADSVHVSVWMRIPADMQEYAQGKRPYDSLAFQVKYHVNE